MNFDWTKPVVIDWSGRRGPLISEDDIKSSVIKRILHNQFYPPFCERKYIPVKPWWNPQDPFGSQFKVNNSKHVLFIPGLRALPAYPQLSTLTKQQHLQGLKVMSTRFEFVQPRNYPQPTQKEIATVEEFQALYEAEQKEYRKWSKLRWINGDCLRVLRPKPSIERVYHAEYIMRARGMDSMPHQYTLAAQIPLQKEGECEMELKGDLINVNVQDLPIVDYPEEMESEFSVMMKSCPVPEPCKEHPCKFVLPHEETVSVLPLAEIHRELAQYAASNGSTFVASENALRCLLDTDRSWMIPVSVVEVICPEYGDLKTIVVLGSEFNAQKECSMQRTYKAYKHLLRHTFAPSIGQYKSKSPTKQSSSPQKLTSSPPANKKSIPIRNDRFVPLHDDLKVSNDKDAYEKRLISDGERKNEPKKLLDLCEPIKEPDRINKSNEKPLDQCVRDPDNSQCIDEPSSDPDQLTIDNCSENNPVPSYYLDSFEAFEQCAKEPDNSYEHMDEPSSQVNQLTVESSDIYSVPSYGLDFYEPDYNKDSTISYSHNEPFRLMNNAGKPESSCGLDFYQPEYSINTRPNYSRDNDDPSSEPEKLMINNSIIMNPESMNKSNQDYEASSRNSDVTNYDRPSYSYYDPNNEPDKIDSLSECNPETNSALDFHELDCDTIPHNDESSEPDEPMINDQSNSEIDDDSYPAIETRKDALIFKINDVSLPEINEETFKMLQTSDILGTSSNTVLETNKKLTPSLNFETNTALNFNTNNVGTTETCLEDKHNKSIAPIKCKDNESTIASKQCESRNAEIPMTPSPIKPCRIYVRNLSISELKANNIAALFNNPNTEVPEKTHSVTQINDDVSIFNESPEKSIKGPARLGISGIISRNPNSAVANKQNTKNNPLFEKIDELPRLGVSDNNKNKISFKNSDSKCIEIGNTVTKQVVPTKTGTSRIDTRSRNISGICENTKTMIEKTKEVSRISEISGIITRNRSLSGTVNDNEGVIEKSKEVTPKVEKSRRITRNQNVKVNDPMLDKAKKVSSFGITRMITRNRSLSGTEEVLEKSKEVTPKLEISKKKNINQNPRVTCKSRNIDDPIYEKANEVSRLRISGMITRNRSLSGTDNGNESIEHTENSKEKSSKKTSEDIDKNLTSPKKISKRAVSIAPVGNTDTKISQHLNIESNKHSSEKLKLHECDKDEVNKNTLRKSIELSPIKPCSVSVEPIDVEPYVRKRISETNISGIESLTEKFVKTINVDSQQSAAKARKRSVIESNTEMTYSNTEMTYTIEKHNRYANIKTYSRKSNKNAAAKKKSLHKPCIKKSTNSIKKCLIESEDNCILDYSNHPSTKRVRQLSEQIILEHDYCPIAKNSPLKQSISEIEHDYCGSDPSCDESDTDMLFVDCVPALDKYIKHFDIFEETFDASIFNNKNLRNVVGNITPSKLSSNTKTTSKKISLSELFGYDSDSDEPMVLPNNRNQKYDTKKLNFADSIDKRNTEKSPLKPCLRKSINVSPRNSKRKLSFSDPLTSDPEFNTCVSEPDSEDAIAGFLNDVAVPCKTLTKNIKKQTTVNRTYGLRSRKKTNTRTAKKSKIAEQKENGRFTKIIPDKQTNARNIQRRSSCSNSESDDSVSRSRQGSLASKQNINTNKQKIQMASLRRSRRLSTRMNAESSDQLTSKEPTAKTNAKESSDITKGRRFSDRLSTKENVQPKTRDVKNNISKLSSKNTSKMIKRDKNRRKSLPSNIFSETTKNNLILRSKSLTNLNENKGMRTRHSSESYLYNTRSKSPNKGRSDSLKLSERTKRYLRRVFNFDCSESDQSGDEISRCTERHIHRSIPLSSGTELSDTENKKTRRYTRSSKAFNTKESMKTRSRNKTDYLEKTKRYTLRSAAAYSSCDEMELSAPVRRMKTKIPGSVNTNCSTNTVNTSAESNTEQFETDEIKTEPETEMDPTEIVEKFQIEIEVTEETDSVDNKTLPVLDFELPTNSYEGIASQANEMTDENLCMSNVENNETDNEFDGMHSNSTDALIVTKELIEMKQTESTDFKEIQQIPNMNTKCIDASLKTLKNNSVDVDSDNFDFFNMCVNDEFNILHFTTTNETDSEEDSLTIDESKSNRNVTNTVKQSNNNKPKDIQPKTPETVKCNLFGESSKHQAKVENITQSLTVTPTNNLRSKDKSHFACASSDDLSYQNKVLQKTSLPKDVVNDVIGVFNCTCKGTPFEVPPPRSFKKWRVRNKNSQISFNVIVHSSHRVRKGASEVLLEPIVEYQPELGGSRQPRGRVRGAALALMLRHNPLLINVRIDHENGNVIVIDEMNNEEFTRRHGDRRGEVADTLHTALDQLRYLLPGQYVLAHDPSHGSNAMLYTTRGAETRAPAAPAPAPAAPAPAPAAPAPAPAAPAPAGLSLQAANINIPDAEDALFAKVPPELDLVMLPYHKHRSILPLAFTPHKLGVREEQKLAAALARARPPPTAIQWPKKKKKSRKRSTRQNVSRPQ